LIALRGDVPFTEPWQQKFHFSEMPAFKNLKEVYEQKRNR
jgi:hypothetical protein